MNKSLYAALVKICTSRGDSMSLFKIVNTRKTSDKTLILNMQRADFRLLRELVSKIPWNSAFEGWEAHNSKVSEVNKQSRRVSWLIKNLLPALRSKRKVYVHYKQGRLIWEDYWSSIRYCREIICAAEAQLQLTLASTMEHNENGFLKYVNSNRRSRDSISSLLDDDDHNTNRYIGKTEIFNAFFSSVFNTNVKDWNALSRELENHDWDNNKWGSKASSWIVMKSWKFMIDMIIY